MKNILIVDSDLGFIYWLGGILIGAECQPWPACCVPDAFKVAGHKPSVPLDLLIVNPSLPGISNLVSSYRRSQPRLKVMGLGPHNKEILPGVTSWREKPSCADESAKQEWTQAIERFFSGHTRAA